MKVEGEMAIKPRFEVSTEIEAYREKQLKVLDEKGNETYVRKSRPLDCLDLRQTCTPELVQEMMQPVEDLYDVDRLVRYCFRSTILQLKRGVLNGITIESFRKEKSDKK